MIRALLTVPGLVHVIRHRRFLVAMLALVVPVVAFASVGAMITEQGGGAVGAFLGSFAGTWSSRWVLLRKHERDPKAHQRKDPDHE